VNTDTFRVAIEGAVGRITLDRPPLNVLTTAMMRDLARAVDHLAGTSEVRVVRLDAAGKAFCAGVDVGEHRGPSLAPMMEALFDLFAAFELVPQPIVAVVDGAALGGGCELVLACDLCLASERATFGQPEIRLGVFAPPASVLLPRIVGERRALGLLLSGETVSAREAEAMGLVNRVFEDGGFASEAGRWIERLVTLSGTALRYAKRAVGTARELPLRDAHAEVQRLYLEELMRTSDAEEGLAAFLEKRAPVFRHR
jgi:cyclohexa-1,5-dienecarbonyl-CoA hydratase